MSRLLYLLVDAVAATAAYAAAYRFRFEGPEASQFAAYALRAAPLVIACQLGAIGLAGGYGGPRRGWVWRLALATLAGTAAGAAATATVFGLHGLSRSALAAAGVLAALAVFTWRAAYGLARLAAHSRAVADDTSVLEDRAVQAPSVIDTLVGVFRYRELLKNLVLKDLKLKYRGSVFGFLWSLVNPLLMVAVYSLAFRYLLQIREPGFVFLLLLGILAWTFFASSAGMSTGAIVDAGGLVKSVSFPRSILPIATVLFNLSQYLLTVVVFVPLMLVVFGVAPTPKMLLFPVFLALQVMFTIGVALLLATGTAFFRDVRHILEIALSALFWTTPIVYPLVNVPEPYRQILILSPMSPFVVAYQQIFFYGQWPDRMVWLAAMVYAAAAFTAGSLLFTTYEDRLAEQV